MPFAFPINPHIRLKTTAAPIPAAELFSAPVRIPRAPSSLITYRFTFFYIDRLTHNLGNQIEIQSVGIQALDNILRLLENAGIYSASEVTYTTFNQRFQDECAGVFASVAFQVPVQGMCGESFADFNNDFNEDFAIADVTIY